VKNKLKLIKDKRGQSAFAGIILMAAGLVALVAMFSIAPLIGHSVDTAITIPGDEYADGTLTLSGVSSDAELIDVSTVTFELNLSGEAAGAGHVEVNISDSAILTTVVNLIAAINDNATTSALVTATNTSTTVVLTADTIGAAANSIVTTETMANGAFGAATLTGGVDGSDWNPTDNPNVPTGRSIWTSNAPLLALVVTVSILVMVIGAIMTFGAIGRRGRD